ncbi:hypothetical protein DVK85_10425 [Flavobacterium arcticum]|uniref:Toxin-antitoxin system YwqK family antitoxin n=1 Tax=Flavobacterium arcticum TaxID=1784713 RepID=A0A345HDG6_9FLAO|nr:hypothetical protein [Flavobacterium arcticum]AXG74626.1 hypothetical protein DVK85_10425 [Flavobacterium arcticum]KAF2512250.1 hypothetical protein E0W72_03240 [Flavobacterium arcticum]
MKTKGFLILCFFITILCYSQKPYIEKYDNGQLKIQAFVKDNTLDGSYLEYYENGNIKTKGSYRDCEYKTNVTHISLFSCSVGRHQLQNKISYGKKNGLWEYYYENGNLDFSENYYCDVKQGESIAYYSNGKVWFQEFYNAGKLITSHEFLEDGSFSTLEIYSYIYCPEKYRDLENKSKIEFYEDGTLKKRSDLQDFPDETKEHIIEYYQNGFIKLEETLIDNYRVGNYYEYYENGNAKYMGQFKNGKQTGEHFYFNVDGSLIKSEIWRKGKLKRVEFSNKS